jgi:hypothetical protein
VTDADRRKKDWSRQEASYNVSRHLKEERLFVIKSTFLLTLTVIKKYHTVIHTAAFVDGKHTAQNKLVKFRKIKNLS